MNQFSPQTEVSAAASLSSRASAVRPAVSIVIVSFNTRDVLRECLQTLQRQAGSVSYETVVIDNNSRDVAHSSKTFEDPLFSKWINNAAKFGNSADKFRREVNTHIDVQPPSTETFQNSADFLIDDVLHLCNFFCCHFGEMRKVEAQVFFAYQ